MCVCVCQLVKISVRAQYDKTCLAVHATGAFSVYWCYRVGEGGDTHRAASGGQVSKYTVSLGEYHNKHNPPHPHPPTTPCGDPVGEVVYL